MSDLDEAPLWHLNWTIMKSDGLSDLHFEWDPQFIDSCTNERMCQPGTAQFATAPCTSPD